MRYALAMVLTLVLGVTAVMQAAFADEHEQPQMPVPAVAQYEQTDPGTVAGPMTPSFQSPAVEHDLDRN